MRIALYQGPEQSGDVARNLELLGSLARVAAERGARLLICPELFLTGYNIGAAAVHRLAGVDFVAIPTALMRPYEIVATTLVPSRAYENQVFVAYVNRCGREGAFEYCGLSCVVAPDGTDLARAGAGEELLLADLDIALHRDTRAPNTYLRDRRPELYAALTMQPDPHRPGQQSNGSREEAPR